MAPHGYASIRAKRRGGLPTVRRWAGLRGHRPRGPPRPIAPLSGTRDCARKGTSERHAYFIWSLAEPSPPQCGNMRALLSVMQFLTCLRQNFIPDRWPGASPAMPPHFLNLTKPHQNFTAWPVAESSPAPDQSLPCRRDRSRPLEAGNRLRCIQRWCGADCSGVRQTAAAT